MGELKLIFELPSSQGKEGALISIKNSSGKRNIFLIFISKRTLALRVGLNSHFVLSLPILKFMGGFLQLFFMIYPLPPNWPPLLHVVMTLHPNLPLHILFLPPALLSPLLNLVVSQSCCIGTF